MAAVKCAENREAALISEDTDLLVLLCYHANLENNRIFFFKSEPKQRFSSKTRPCCLLPFIHTLTGCDTTSRVYGISKGAALKNSTADQQFKLHTEIFLKESSKCDIAAAGEGALVSLYRGLQIEDLNLLRFRKFANYDKLIICTSINSATNIRGCNVPQYACLPSGAVMDKN